MCRAASRVPMWTNGSPDRAVELVQPRGGPVALHHRVVHRDVGGVLEQVGGQSGLGIEGDGHGLQVRASWEGWRITGCSAARASIAALLAAAAKSSPGDAYRIERELLTIRPRPSDVAPARTAAAASPPWTPNPGTRIGSSPTTSRTTARSSGYVAPTTSPHSPCSAHRSATMRATRTYNGSPPQSSSCRSALPGLLVRHSAMTAPPSAKYGNTESRPRYGLTVTACAPYLLNASRTRSARPWIRCRPAWRRGSARRRGTPRGCSCRAVRAGPRRAATRRTRSEV